MTRNTGKAQDRPGLWWPYRVVVLVLVVLLLASHLVSTTKTPEPGCVLVVQAMEGHWPASPSQWCHLVGIVGAIMGGLVVLIDAVVRRGRLAPYAAVFVGMVGFVPPALPSTDLMASMAPTAVSYLLTTAACAGSIHAWFGLRERGKTSAGLSWAGGLQLATASAILFILWHQWGRSGQWPVWDRDPLVVLLIAAPVAGFVAGSLVLAHAGLPPVVRVLAVSLSMLLTYVAAMLPIAVASLMSPTVGRDYPRERPGSGGLDGGEPPRGLDRLPPAKDPSAIPPYKQLAGKP